MHGDVAEFEFQVHGRAFVEQLRDPQPELRKEVSRVCCRPGLGGIRSAYLCLERQWCHSQPLRCGPFSSELGANQGHAARRRSRRDWPKDLHLELNCHQATGVGFSDVYGRMWWDRAAPTLTSRCNSISNGRFGHPEQHRAISLREAAALQTFPDDYEFFGTRNRIAQWIGNAVPVSFAEELGRTALKAVT